MTISPQRFLPRDAMLARYMQSSCVRPSVCLSQAGILPKRLNAVSRKQRHTIAHGPWFSDDKDIGEIPTQSLPTGRQTEVGQVQIGDFRPVSRYISKTVQDKDIVTMECE